MVRLSSSEQPKWKNRKRENGKFGLLKYVCYGWIPCIYCNNFACDFMLVDGVSEEELLAVEDHMQHKLPEDLRLSYRIHNGQDFLARAPGYILSLSLILRQRNEQCKI